MNTSTQNEFSFNTRDMLESSVSLLHDYLIRPVKHDGKMRFKKLNETNHHFVAEMPTDESSTTNVSLYLDRSEFKGNLNFNTFKKYLSHLLTLINKTLEAGDEIHLREESAGQHFVVSLPAALELDGQLNVLMLGFNLQAVNEITIELLFFEPSQFEQASPGSEA